MKKYTREMNLNVKNCGNNYFPKSCNYSISCYALYNDF